MGSIWDDRLAEVWAPPGRAGSGVALGARGVLTARHVIAEVADGTATGPVLARVIRRGSPPAWVPMRVVDADQEWDLAVLEVDQTRPESAAWLRPGSPSPALVVVGGASEDGCEAVGFPDEEVQRLEGVSPGEWVRQSEMLRGTLLPEGQAKPPTFPRLRLPRAWMPLDTGTTTPGAQTGWQGMSGAGVVLADGRLAGIAVAAEVRHQQRRLYVVPLAAALTQSAELAAAVAVVVGAPVVPKVRAAPLYERLLYRHSLGVDGAPVRLGEVAEADLGAFGVKPVDLAGEPAYLHYVPRDDDGSLTQALGEAAAAKRMLLLVGDSGSGKSRSAAQAACGVLPEYRLLRPKEDRLSELPDLALADLGPVLVWLDDIEKYAHPALRAILEQLLEAGAVVVGTVRRAQLEDLTPIGEIRKPAGEALTDQRLVHRLNWKREWSQAERDRTAEHVTNPVALQAVANGLPLGVWAVAGPDLVKRLANADGDEDYPARFSLVRAVLDWHLTGLTTPTPRRVAIDLLNLVYLQQPASPDDVTDAITWCTTPIERGGRRGHYSLLTLQDDGLTINDYIQDHDRRYDPPPIPDPTWSAALANTPNSNAMWNVGVTAYNAGHTATAQTAMRTLADAGNTDAMYVLGLLLVLAGEDPTKAQAWWERAADAGNTDAMFNLGKLLLEDQDLAKAQAWWKRAASAGHTGAMFNLGVLLHTKDRTAAREWYERAATAGHTGAMHTLAVLLEDQNLTNKARGWYERAATAGHTGAMNDLGVLLHAKNPTAARGWYERAATAGNTDAMFNLGLLLKDQDPAKAWAWWERAATAGDTDAMCCLGLLMEDQDPAKAWAWWERAADAGATGAMVNLGVLLKDRDPAKARAWWKRAATAGASHAMVKLRRTTSDRAASMVFPLTN